MAIDALGRNVKNVGELGLGEPEVAGVGIEIELDLFAASFVNENWLCHGYYYLRVLMPIMFDS